MKPTPVLCQLTRMQFRPSFYKTPFFSWKISTNDLHRIYREDGRCALEVSLIMRQMVWRTRFCEHTNDNTEKTAYFWQRAPHSAIASSATAYLVYSARSSKILQEHAVVPLAGYRIGRRIDICPSIALAKDNVSTSGLRAAISVYR